MENRSLYVVTEFEESSAPDVPLGTEPSELARKRLEAAVRLMALGARYVGSAGDRFDEAMRTEATTPNVLIANLTELLSPGNPDNAAAIQHVINTTTPDELEGRLAEVLDDIEERGLSREQMLAEIEALGKEAERLNGFLPFDMQIKDNDALKAHVADTVDRHGFDVDLDLLGRDEDAFWEAFEEAQYTSMGRRFHVLSGYLVILHSICTSKLAHPNTPLGEERDAAVDEVASTYGSNPVDRWAGKVAATHRVKRLVAVRIGSSITHRLREKVFGKLAALVGG